MAVVDSDFLRAALAALRFDAAVELAALCAALKTDLEMPTLLTVRSK